MAAIRCQACGKPNPDFLEECQFCDARLKPLTGILTPSPNALPPLAPMTPPTPPPTLADNSNIIKCQACGKPNPAYLDTCQFCDARLRPLTAEPGPPDESQPVATEWLVSTRAAPTTEPAEALPDWLRAMEPSTAQPMAMPEPEPSTDMPDWMRASAEPAPPAASAPAPTSSTDDEVPDWLRAMQAPTPASEASADIPDWMRASAEPAEPTPVPSGMSAEPAQPTADEDVPDWLRAIPSSSPAPAAPDWMGAAPTPSADEPEPTEDSATAWLVSTRTPPETPVGQADDMPDWLRAMEPSTAQPLAMPEPPASAPTPDWMSASPPAASDDIPDWMRATEAPLAEATPAGDLPDWMGASAPAASVESAPAAVDDGMPDWLRAIQSSASTPEAPVGGETPAGDLPDWMSAMDNASTQAALPPVSADMALPDDAPDWLKAMQSTGELSALEAAAPESAIPATETGGDWLSALRDSAAELEPLPIGEAPTFTALSEEGPVARSSASGLEQAALPSWLAAMKPIDVQATPLDEEADTYEERVGVLAGMRGVLRAEPVVALPRKSTVQVHKLEATTDQTRQANVLAALVSAEITAHVAPKRRAAIVPMLERWLVVAVLLAAVALPLFGVPGLFPLPTTISLQTQAAFNAVNAFPADKPALVVFDYDPAQSGELNPSARALVKHLLLRGVTVAGVSTRPAGAALGDAVLNEVAISLEGTFSYTYGVNYISLGYLPGGPVGVAQFSANPRGAFTSDFRGQHSNVWNTSALTGLNAIENFSLKNFGGLIILAATPDSARAWIEQAHPQAPDVAMVMAVSAGVEPLILPYAEGDQPTVTGIVSGVPGGTQYEAFATFNDDATDAVTAHTTMWNWNALGGGLILGALPLLVLGNFVASIVSALRRRRPRRR